jgi:hypothetical protein
MADKVEAAAQTADDFIMGLCEPKKMSPAQALDFLERVVERCRSAIEALRDENEDLE